jgi:DNA recombination protein RmuC
LFNEISRLKELNQQISQDAVNLTKALTRDSKAQGNWGELVLEKILEESGLSRGREFDIVSSGYYDQQQPYQPDVIVHLPDGRDVVIDSKINLSLLSEFPVSWRRMETSSGFSSGTSSGFPAAHPWTP